MGDGFAVRRYANFTVASRRMASNAGGATASAEGFTSLAGYLFGDNEEEKSMKMTMPVEIDFSDDQPDIQTMSFVIPIEDVAADEGLPKPRDTSVQLRSVPERLVAVRRFPGVATKGEV